MGPAGERGDRPKGRPLDRGCPRPLASGLLARGRGPQRPPRLAHARSPAVTRCRLASRRVAPSERCPERSRFMKKLFALVALALITSVGVAFAQDEYKGACGFHNIEAPAGIRWWLSDKLALDAGLGFGSNEINNDNFSHWALDVGLPIKMRSWDKVNVLLRPGILYTSQEVDINPGPILDKDNDTSMT